MIKWRKSKNQNFCLILTQQTEPKVGVNPIVSRFAELDGW